MPSPPRSSEKLKRKSMTDCDEVLVALLHGSSLGCVVVDKEGDVQEWNEAAERMLGWKKDEILGQPLAVTLQSADGEEFLTQRGPNRSDCSFRTKGGEVLKVETGSSLLPDGSSRLLLLQDVTEKKFLEKALLESAEREQRRIGQELHDGLCQHLLGAAFSAKALAGSLDRDKAKQAPQLHDLARLINDAVSQVRDISRGLHPVEQDAAGLMSALQELANRAKGGMGYFQCDKRVLVSDASKARNAYRIAHETVTALQQAQARKIAISLFEADDSISLCIVGMGEKESELTANPAGVAARILHYRAEALQGSVTSDFDPKSGTKVTCIFPS